jgi:hypothetical protein
VQDINEDNPGAIIVFATLSPEYSAADKKLLAPFVQACRKYAADWISPSSRRSSSGGTRSGYESISHSG